MICDSNNSITPNSAEEKVDVDEDHETRIKLAYICDDWIFDSLGKSFPIDYTEEKQQQQQQKEEICVKHIINSDMDNENIRKRLQLAMNETKKLRYRLYSLIVTARAELKKLNQEKIQLSHKLNANFIIECSSCKSVNNIRKNSMKPKYLKIFKGRNAVELLFDNYQNLQKWLVLNNLDEWDGFSFLNENSRRTYQTLESSGSLIAQKTDEIFRKHNIQAARNACSSANSSRDSDMTLNLPSYKSSFWERKKATNKNKSEFRSNKEINHFSLEKRQSTECERNAANVIPKGNECQIEATKKQFKRRKPNRSENLHENGCERNSPGRNEINRKEKMIASNENGYKCKLAKK